MKRFSLAVAFAVALIAAPAMAQSTEPTPAAAIDTSGLTEAQVANLAAQAAEARAATPASKAAEVNEWVNIGSGIGSGLAAAARETGQVVNEFAETPVGKLTVLVIMFKVMGGDLIQLFIGLLFFITSVVGWTACFRRIFAVRTVITIDPTTKIKTITRDPGSYHTEAMIVMFIAAIALTVIWTLITFL